MSRDEIAFYASVARKATARNAVPRVLEAACGSGRIARELCRRGLSVTGIDSSAAMLAAAGWKTSKARFVLADIRSMPVPSASFDCVVLALNSFSHLLTNKDARTFLLESKRVLVPGGLLAITLFCPDPIRLSGDGKSLRLIDGHIDQSATAGAGPVPDRPTAVYETVAYHPESRCADFVWYYEYDQTAGHGSTAPEDSLFREARFSLRLWYPHELALLLSRAGFVITGFHQDYLGAPFSRGSELLVVTAGSVAPSSHAGRQTKI